MTSSAKARTCPTPTARQKRVWEKAAPSYDKQIAFFEKIQFGRPGMARRARPWPGPGGCHKPCPS